MNYNEKINEMRNELEKKEEVAGILNKLYNDMKWDTMKMSEELDENGDRIFEAPTEEDWGYRKYIAYKEIIELVSKHYFK